MRWMGHVASMRDTRNAYRIFVEKFEGKRPVGRSRRRWQDNIRIDLRETGWNVVKWMHLAQDRGHWRALVKTVMSLLVP
jgi:hypothetical protein